MAYTLLEKKSRLHELEEKMTKSEMNDNTNVMRRSESKEQNRTARCVQGTQYSVVRARDKTAADQKDQGGTGRARTTATSNPGLRTTQRKDVRMGMCSRQAVLRVGSDDNCRGRCDGVNTSKEVCDVRGTVTGNVSESNELTKKKGTTVRLRSWNQRRNWKN